MARLIVCSIVAMLGASPAQLFAYDPAGFHAMGSSLEPSARAGREIWYKATAGNSRFHSYVMPQRLGVLIDWYRVLRTDRRESRFGTWGLINDPECCRPGAPGCPAKSAEETFGFDWCHGDGQLLPYVGDDGFRDPACDFVDAPVAEDDPHGPTDQREDACLLAFGTSAGALGLRKFPNPRFDPARWRAANGSRSGTWEGFNRRVDGGRGSRLLDASIEPPFRIGMACGACHIALDPTKPPRDPNAPAWENIAGLVGNQYTRMSEILASGMPTRSLEWQVFSHARPGTVDTSAVPNDQVNNPGSVNAIVNFAQRPRFEDESVVAWRKIARCPREADDCWCQPGRPGKCWQQSLRIESVHHFLKGGEDSIGAPGAIQRVYVNIGVCAEQCWVNHLSDPRQLDPAARNYDQTPFDIAQCRRDCPAYRAVEDRIGNIVDFFLSPKGGTADLLSARANQSREADIGAVYEFEDLVAELEAVFGDGAVDRGRSVFARNCARCHSSLPHPDETTDFHALDAVTGGRADWLGNDRAVPATEVGSYRCRSLHANHLAGRVWAAFASETYRGRPDVPDIDEPSDGGRGYYRNVSLLNLWAYAPFMHNNAVGPELCGDAPDPRDRFYESPYVDARGDAVEGPDCWRYDPSIDGRFALYVASMDALLNPDARIPKVTRLPEPMVLERGLEALAPASGSATSARQLTVPAGTPVAALGNFRHKQFAASHGSQGGVWSENPSGIIASLADRHSPYSQHMSCAALPENGGHRFGEALSQADKRALTAFLATL